MEFEERQDLKKDLNNSKMNRRNKNSTNLTQIKDPKTQKKTPGLKFEIKQEYFDVKEETGFFKTEYNGTNLENNNKVCKEICKLCNIDMGVLKKCSEPCCDYAFHPECARLVGLKVKAHKPELKMIDIERH